MPAELLEVLVLVRDKTVDGARPLGLWSASRLSISPSC
ncbi:hypothetical protein HNQ09_003038 [Deinococcus budaensis]|uniref:Uncharacterized protein n=1 Tax=Deinococcus budaensis TaxID=1665626 RepID=A0A7W8LR70_9DEIO|nr:hypothetical protein [Deinococcus budaensis]